MQEENAILFERLRYCNKPAIRMNEIQMKARQVFQEKVESKEYLWESLSKCPICLSGEFELLSERDRYGLYYRVVICKLCGLILANPRLNKDSSILFYKDDYRTLYLGEVQPKEGFFRSQIYKGQKIYRFLKSHDVINGQSKNILEVGCGAGGILKYFAMQGHEVTGIDLDDEYVSYGKTEHGLNLYVSDLTGITFSRKPDIVIYSHVMEHLLDPLRDLQYLREMIGQKTKLYIEVPGIKSLGNNYKMDILRYLQNAHTFHFSLSTLKNLLAAAGYRVISGDEHIRCIARPSDETKIHLVNDYENIVKLLRTFENRRRFYFLNPRSLAETIKKFIIEILELFNLRAAVKRLFGRYPSRN